MFAFCTTNKVPGRHAFQREVARIGFKVNVAEYIQLPTALHTALYVSRQLLH